MVANLLINIDENKSLGSDGISPLVLKKCANYLALPLSIIFKRSLDTNQVPTKWKYANITPIFKKGIVREKITDYLVRHDLLSKKQHGFVKHKACVTNLLETIDIIT